MLAASLAALFGLLIGSFLNVCIFRLPRDLSVVKPRSYCPECEHPIAWYDNVPLLSYLLLRGHCRHCGKPIRARYPIVELITGVLFFWIVFHFGLSFEAAKLCTFTALLIGLGFADLEERILPDEFTLGGIGLGVLFAVFVPVSGLMSMLLPHSWGDRALSVCDAAFATALASGMLWTLRVLYFHARHREGMGMGDVKMIGMLAAFLGLPGALLAMMAGAVLGSIGGLTYVLVNRKSIATYELPFGSFLSAAAIVVALFWDPLLRFSMR